MSSLLKACSLPLLAMMLLLISCTTTITKTKEPKFNATPDSLSVTLNKLVTCQHINVKGEEITTNGKTQSEMEIDIINGKQIPDVGPALRSLGKTIASAIKMALTNKNDFDSYKVLFVKQEETSVTTSRSWTGYTYKSVDL
jgi:hypothetical protein